MDFLHYFLPDFSRGIPPEAGLTYAWFWIIPLVASGISAIAQARAQKKEREANRELAQYQFEQNQAMVDRQNSYNAPVSQLGRYTDAGLNPNLIYGSGASGGNQVSTASYQRPEQRFQSSLQHLPEVLSQYQDFQMKSAQIDNIKAQTENTHQKTMTEAVSRYVKQITGDRGHFELTRSQDLAPYQQEIVKQQAAAAEPKMFQEFERLQQMYKQSALMGLDIKAKSEQLTTQQLDQEIKKSILLFNQYRNEWIKMGVTTSDNPIIRIIVRMMGESGLVNDLDVRKMFNK